MQRKSGSQQGSSAASADNTQAALANGKGHEAHAPRPKNISSTYLPATGQVKQAVVTGGAGFIGSHLCERLLQMGWRVHCVDDLSSGVQQNIHAWRDVDGFTFDQRDVSQPFADALPAFDLLFHLACPASPVTYQRQPIQTLKTSVLGTLHALEAALKQRARLVLASTSEVYGDPEVHPQTEDYVGHVDPTGPRACYDEGKRCAETFAFEFAQQHQLDVRIARIFNTYGPRMQPDDGRVVSNFVVQALRGLPITVYGDGTQTRSLCFIDDLVDGLLALGHADHVGVQPINLGNPAEITMAQLAERVLQATGSRSTLQYRALPVDDPRRRRPDISRAQQQLNWSPRIALTEGLAHTVQWFKHCLANGLEPTAASASVSNKDNHADSNTVQSHIAPSSSSSSSINTSNTKDLPCVLQ